MMSLQQSVPLTQVPLVAPAGRKTQLKTGAGGGSSGEEAKQGKMNQRKKNGDQSKLASHPFYHRAHAFDSKAARHTPIFNALPLHKRANGLGRFFSF